MRKHAITFDRPRTERVATAPAPAYDWRTPVRLAFVRLLAVLSAIITAMIAGGLISWAQDTGRDWPKVAAGLAALCGLVLVLSMWSYTNNVRRAIWAQEEAQGRDLDGDGQAGRPKKIKRFIPFTSHGQPQAPIEIDDTEEETYLPGFDLDLEDVRAFVEEANRRGLERASWLIPNKKRFQLFSGERVTRGVYDRIVQELIRLNWAAQDGAGTHFVRPLEDILAELED